MWIYFLKNAKHRSPILSVKAHIMFVFTVLKTIPKIVLEIRLNSHMAIGRQFRTSTKIAHGSKRVNSRVVCASWSDCSKFILMVANTFFYLSFPSVLMWSHSGLYTLRTAHFHHCNSCRRGSLFWLDCQFLAGSLFVIGSTGFM